MIILLKVLSLITLIFGLWTIFCSIGNYIYFKALNNKGRKHNLKEKPLVSIIIPARNEEKNLSQLLSSLMKQDYENIEILVIDDKSEDKTWEIIEKYSEKDKRIKGYKTDDAILSKRGKINALLHLIPHANGEYYLFTDADTIHSPSSISLSLKTMKEKNLDIFSGFPAEYSETYLSSVITSSMSISNSFLPHFILNNISFYPLSIGIGQFIMVKSEAYKDCGGYEKVKDEICDDLSIIKLFIKSGKKYAFTSLSDRVSCKMYNSAKEAFLGLERSIAGVFPSNIFFFIVLILVVLLLLSVFFSPLGTPLFLFNSLYHELVLLLLGYAFIILSWFLACILTKFPLLVSLSSPLAILFTSSMYIDGLYKKMRGKGFIWKGRKV